MTNMAGTAQSVSTHESSYESRVSGILQRHSARVLAFGYALIGAGLAVVLAAIVR